MKIPINLFSKDFNEYPEYDFSQNANIFCRLFVSGCPEMSAIIVFSTLC